MFELSKVSVVSRMKSGRRGVLGGTHTDAGEDGRPEAVISTVSPDPQQQRTNFCCLESVI